MKIEGESTRNPDDMKKALYLHNITVSNQMCQQQHKGYHIQVLKENPQAIPCCHAYGDEWFSHKCSALIQLKYIYLEVC